MKSQRIKKIPTTQVKLLGSGMHLQNLASLPLLLMVMLLTLSTIRSESSFHHLSSGSLMRNFNPTQRAASNHPVAASSGKQSTTYLNQTFRSSDGLEQQQQQQQQQQHRQQQQASVYTTDNANNHFVLVGEVNEQSGFPGLNQFSPIVDQDNAESKRIQSNLSPQIALSNNKNEESIILTTETNPVSSDQNEMSSTLPPSPPPPPPPPMAAEEQHNQDQLANEQMNTGGLIEEHEISEGLGMDTTHSVQQSKEQMLERRFGLFKKGQHGNNNNLPYYNYGSAPVPYFNDCERCAPGLGLSAAAAATSAPVAQQQQGIWLPEQQPLPSPFGQPLLQPTSYASAQQPNMLIPSLGNHFGSSFKSKLNKFHFTKPLGLRDSYFGQQNYYQNHRYRFPMSSGNRMPYRSAAFLNQPFNCVHQLGLLGGANANGPIVGSILSNQHSIGLSGEDLNLKDTQQLSYSN